MMNEKVKSNIESWKKSLLDISSRNQAINFKRRKSSTLQIIYPMFEDFLEKTSTCKGFTFAEMFDDEEEDEEDSNLLDEKDDEYITVYGVKLPVKDTYTNEELIPVITNYLSKKKGTYLFSPCNNRTQRKILRNLMKKARTFKEENAINVLYIAVGYLEWYESKDSDDFHRAPLLYIAAELSQDSFDAPFEISIPEGDFLLNDSLLRKLMQDYKIDISFDPDRDDLSNIEIYNEYKKLIYSKLPDRRWKIYDELDLGIFSFSKINMVKDLEENAQRISDNSLIQRIVGDFDSVEPESVYDEDEIDKVIDPNNYYHILEADSSQEIAIQSAVSGKSFVLQGPPGTGKSQTITNIITELIARNKKVLFVAEKKAALDVVYNNLKKIGLNDYALPIHNSKLDKKEVLRELAATLEKGQHSIDVDKQFSTDQIHKYSNAKLQLIEYPKILLEKRYPINKSLYQMYGLLLKYQNCDELLFSVGNRNLLGEKELQLIENAINSFFKASSNVGFSSTEHPLYGFKYDQLTIKEKEDIDEEMKAILKAILVLSNDLGSLDLFKLKNDLTIADLETYSKLLNHLKYLKRINVYLLECKSINDDIETYSSLQSLEIKINDLKRQIEENSDIEITNIDTDKYKRIVRMKNTFFKRILSSDYRKVVKECSLYFKSSKIKYKDLLTLLTRVNDYKSKTLQYTVYLNKLSYKTETMTQVDISQNLYDLSWVKEYRAIYEKSDFVTEQDRLSVLNKYLANIVDYNHKIDKFFEDFDIYLKKSKTILTHFNEARVYLQTMNIHEITHFFDNIVQNMHRMEEILSFNYSLTKCREIGLSDYCEKIIDHKINNNFIGVFYKRFYILLVDEHLKNLLPGFDGSTLELARGNFKDAELTIQQMAKATIERNIINKIPNYNGVEGYNIEVSTLRAEANKSRKILPFRVLFSRIPNLITQLKPCLMMSPLSVSTFLRGTNMIFDTVIFDEASQVKPENAIGAIFRANQFIVTGDKEQLPPTNFFQNVEDDDGSTESSDDTTSFDSILDVTSSFISPVKLRWHYRSKFEELIRPSNKEIYKDLITFPSISKPKTFEGIKYSYVNGLYADRKNELEADHVIKTLADIIENYGMTKSVGVVTFNNEQQLLIERKINHFRKTHTHYEEFFTNNENEPFFVKNIETVQGDERDIIIISIGYGPDGKGKLSMNFGPLNQSNGYRRLNVAVTRAKLCLVLITSLRGKDIDLNRTESRGVRFLKHYLEYAEFGEDDKVDNLDDLANFDSPFEEDVYYELVKLGYEVRKQVGCSGYRIDLAIINPANPSNFLLGIECDGATYHSSQSVRDRDRLRQQVLEDRNWTIYRIWSTDWIKNKKAQVEKLDKFIKNINSSIPKLIDEGLPTIPVVTNKKEKSKIEFTLYPNYDDLVSSYGKNLSDRDIQRAIHEIIKITSPIHKEEFKKIVPSFWGREKYTTVVDYNLRPLIRSLLMKGEITVKGDFYIAKDSAIFFRETTEHSSRRDFHKIHPEELKVGVLKVLEITRMMQMDELHTVINKLCGFQSLTSKNKDYVLHIINSLEKTNDVTIIDGNFVELSSETN